MMTHVVHLGDCRDVMATLADCSVDAIVTDPPYELGFMGKAWDASGIAYDVTVWAQCLRVLKPGGHLIAFGGSRTYHRMAVAIEDAGFEIRDQIQWIYGSGFPKSHNLHDDWHGWGTALKPAHEPAVLARKPLRGTVADNVTAWGTGALNIEGARVETTAEDVEIQRKRTGGKISGDITNSIYSKGYKRQPAGNPAGRWPSNVILDEEAAEVLDAQSGERKSGGGNKGGRNTTAFFGSGSQNDAFYEASTGGASRFFYVAKASKREREAGLDGVELQNNMRVNAPRENEEAKHATTRANHHPTVKPLALMRYLVRMVTPPGGVVLDPFTGSGSTGCAAVSEGFHFIGMDITSEYVEIAQKRIAWHAVETVL